MNIDTGNLIFMDIETVPGEQTFHHMTEVWQALWSKKAARTLPPESTIEDHYAERAALYAEFGKVVCISFGYYSSKGDRRSLRLKSLCGDDEKKLLTQFCALLTQFEKHSSDWVFAGHNIREFDLPYLSRRMLINGLGIPACMNFFHLKPWEFKIIDTMHIWRFGDFKHYTSLELLTAALNIPSPKTDMDGSKVAAVFHERDFQRIAEYCQADVVAVANVIQRLNGGELLTDDDIEVIDAPPAS